MIEIVGAFPRLPVTAPRVVAPRLPVVTTPRILPARLPVAAPALPRLPVALPAMPPGVPKLPTLPAGFPRLPAGLPKLPAVPLPRGVPNIPVAVPTSFTPKGVADAAYNTGKQFAEREIQQATGIPITLPSKLTAGEIAKSIGSVFPTDVGEAVDLALNIGAQAASQALTGLLAGAGLGSVVPGLGTVVGIGVALGVAAIKNALKEEPPPGRRKCSTKWDAKPPPPGINAFQLIGWATRERVPLSRAIADEQARRMCGVGPALTYESALGTMRREAIATALGSARNMSLPDVIAALGELRGIPDGAWHFSTRPGPTEKQIIWDRYADDLPKIVAQLQARQSQLVQLLAQTLKLPSASRAQLAVLRPQLVSEVATAARAFQTARTPQNAQWLRRLATALQALGARDQLLQQQMHAQLAQARTRGAQRLATDPAARAAHSAQIQAFLRSERQA